MLFIFLFNACCSEFYCISVKGNTDKWYPYEHYFAKLNGLSNKRERIFGLWANLVAPRKKPLSKRWNDGDAAIESQVKNEIRPVLKGEFNVFCYSLL